jgi:hypothetical protein
MSVASKGQALFKNYSMKKYLLLALCFACYGTLIAQSMTNKRTKWQIEYDILQILDKKEKTYMKDGRYNYVYYHKFDDQPGYSLFQCYGFPLTKEDENSAWNWSNLKYYLPPGSDKFWIDFSKVKSVSFNKHGGYGYDCIYIYTEQTGIVYQRTKYKTYGNSSTIYTRGADQGDYLTQCSLPISNPKIKDLFIEYAALCREEVSKNISSHSTMPLPRQELSREELAQEAKDAEMEVWTDLLSAFNWELTGSSTGVFNPDKRNQYHDIIEKKMNVDYVRMNFVLGNNRIRLNLSPVGFYWVDLPYYKKYNKQNVMVLQKGDFEYPRFYAPTIGLIYCLIAKEDRKDDYRAVEFPVAVNFSPFLGVKNTGFTVANEARDSPFKDYLAPFNYILSGTIGVNLYPDDAFGFSLNTGVTYMGINATSKEVYETDDNQITNAYTIKMDNAKRLLANFELKLLVRF